MNELDLGLVLAAVLAAGLAVWAFRTRRTSKPIEHESTVPLPGYGRPALERAEDNDIVIVPLPSGLDKALIMGSAADLALLDEQGLTSRGPAENPRLVSQTVRRALTGGAYAANEVARRGVDSGRIVKLAPETVKALEKGKPVFDKSKNMLGIIKGDKGKISHVMRIEQGGANAMLVSNAATLAVTAALSLQLEQIQEQLERISAKLDRLIDDINRGRLAEVMGLNSTLLNIWNDIQQRGEISQSEVIALASTRNGIEKLQVESQLKFASLNIPDNSDAVSLNRRKRVDKFEELEDEQDLNYWFMFRIQAELAASRHELLSLLVEQQHHPESAAIFARQAHERIESRSAALAAFSDSLRDLALPDERVRFDSMRVFSKGRLEERQEVVEQMLSVNPRALGRSKDDPFQVDLKQLPSGE